MKFILVVELGYTSARWTLWYLIITGTANFITSFDRFNNRGREVSNVARRFHGVI